MSLNIALCIVFFYDGDRFLPDLVEPKNTEVYRSSVPAGKLKRESWGFCDELPAPLVWRRHRIICMFALTDALTHTRSCVDESALGRTRLSDGPCRSHDVE